MQQAKTSSLSMITECAALLAGQDGIQRERYRRIGECMALLVQIRDDVRDLFGTDTSPDLLLGRSTYPVACFLEQAEVSEKREFEQLIRALPSTSRDVRRLLYDRGAIAESAEKMEEFRQEIYENVAATNNHSAAHRCLLWIVEGLAESVYRTPTVEGPNEMLDPRGPWHDLVREQFDRTFSRLAGTKVATLPTLRPWHMPQWMFVPAQQTIYYPDIEGLPEEVLPAHGRLLGTTDLNQVTELMRAQVPAVLAHEIFHFLRHAAGRMTRDYWHEEWAANRLAVAYLQRFAPRELRTALDLANRILARHLALLDERAERVLRDAHQCRADVPTGYGMDITSMTVVGLDMVRRLAADPIDFYAAFTELLSTPTGIGRGVAA